MRRSTFHRHARAVLDHELWRARGRLAALPRERRRAVEEASSRFTAELVETLLEEARHEPVLEHALVSIYGHEPVWEPRAVLWSAD
jgi:hypothetical protein